MNHHKLGRAGPPVSTLDAVLGADDPAALEVATPRHAVAGDRYAAAAPRPGP